MSSLVIPRLGPAKRISWAAVDGPEMEARLTEVQEAALRRIELASLGVAGAALVLASLFGAAALLVVPSGLTFWIVVAVAVLFALGCGAAYWNYAAVRRDRELSPVATYSGTLVAERGRWRAGADLLLTPLTPGIDIEEGRRYRVRYLSRSHRLLSATPAGRNGGRARGVG